MVRSYRKRRSAIKTDAEILALAKTPISTTHIMQKIGLSYSNMRKKINFLLKCGFIVSDQKLTVTSKVGYKFLRLYRELERLYGAHRRREIALQEQEKTI